MRKVLCCGRGSRGFGNEASPQRTQETYRSADSRGTSPGSRLNQRARRKKKRINAARNRFLESGILQVVMSWGLFSHDTIKNSTPSRNTDQARCTRAINWLRLGGNPPFPPTSVLRPLLQARSEGREEGRVTTEGVEMWGYAVTYMQCRMQSLQSHLNTPALLRPAHRTGTLCDEASTRVEDLRFNVESDK